MCVSQCYINALRCSFACYAFERFALQSICSRAWFAAVSFARAACLLSGIFLLLRARCDCDETLPHSGVSGPTGRMLWLLLGYVYILFSFFVLYIGLPVLGITGVGYVQRSWARRSVCCLLNAVCCPLVCCLLSAVCYLTSTVCCVLCAICYLMSDEHHHDHRGRLCA